MAKKENKLGLLKPKVRRLAEALLKECRRQGLDVAIVQTLRTIEEQERLYACGRTSPSRIVTQARGGYSLHNYGVAFDICPVRNGRADWSDLATFDRAGTIGLALGLDWGGRWKRFRDRPHFQYAAGYDIADFVRNEIDWRKFA